MSEESKSEEYLPEDLSNSYDGAEGSSTLDTSENTHSSEDGNERGQDAYSNTFTYNPSQDIQATTDTAFYEASISNGRGLDDLLKENKEWVSTRIDSLQTVYEKKIEELQMRIDEALRQCALEDEKLADYQDDVNALREEYLAKEQEVKQAHGNIFTAYDALARAKHKHLSEKVRELDQELDDLLNTQLKVAKKKREIAEEIDLGDEEELKNIRNWLLTLQDRIQSRYDSLHYLIKELDFMGLSNPGVNKTLIGLAYMACIACGWFFAVFVNPEQGQIAPKGFWSNFLSQLSLYLSSGFEGKWFPPVFVLGFVLLLLTISWASGFIIKQLNKRKGDEDEFETEDNAPVLNAKWKFGNIFSISHGGSIVARSWIEFLLQLAPVIFILSVILLILVYEQGGSDNTEEKLHDQFSYLSLNIIGIAIVMGLTVLSYVYVGWKFARIYGERVHDRYAKDSTERNEKILQESEDHLIRSHIKTIQQREEFPIRLTTELKWIGLTFIIFNILLGVSSALAEQFGFADCLSSKCAVQCIGAIEFVLLSLIVALGLAYLYAFKAMTETLSFLNDKINRVASGLVHWKNFPLDKLIGETSGPWVASVFEQVYQVLIQRHISLSEQYNSDKRNSKKARRWIIFPEKKEEPERLEGFRVPDIWAEEHFPMEYDNVINAILNWKEHSKILDGIQAKLDAFYEGTSKRFDKIKWSYNRNWDRLVSLRRAVTAETEELELKKAWVKLMGLRKEVAIKEGYDLGKWYKVARDRIQIERL
jgi:hypothetical protein